MDNTYIGSKKKITGMEENDCFLIVTQYGVRRISRANVSKYFGSGSGDPGGGTGDGPTDPNEVDESAEPQYLAWREEAATEDATYDPTTDLEVYGVEVDFANKTFTRLAGAADKTAGSDFDALPMYARKRCIVSDAGEVVAYYGDEGYAADGSAGQVMVECPDFYYRVDAKEVASGTYGTNGVKMQYFVSATKKPGFKLHPAFYGLNGHAISKIYVGAYESGQDSDGKLLSVSGVDPFTGADEDAALFSQAQYEIAARARGSRWSIDTIASRSATQMLFLIEYASFDAQTALGQGFLNHSYPAIKGTTGATDSLGNASGKAETGIAVGSQTRYPTSYRGLESYYDGHGEHVDGILMDEKFIPHICKGSDFGYCSGGKLYSDTALASEIEFGSQYSAFGFSGKEVVSSKSQFFSGYISRFIYDANFDWLFFPGECSGGSSTLPVGDGCQIVRKASEDHTKIPLFFGSNLISDYYSGGGELNGLFYTFCNDYGNIGSTNTCSRLKYTPGE